MNKNEDLVWRALDYLLPLKPGDCPEGGWPDFILYDRRRKFIFCVEVKADTDYVKGNQADCHALLRAAGIPVIVFYVHKGMTLDEVIRDLGRDIDESYDHWRRGYYKTADGKLVLAGKIRRKPDKE